MAPELAPIILLPRILSAYHPAIAPHSSQEAAHPFAEFDLRRFDVLEACLLRSPGQLPRTPQPIPLLLSPVSLRGVDLDLSFAPPPTQVHRYLVALAEADGAAPDLQQPSTPAIRHQLHQEKVSCHILP